MDCPISQFFAVMLAISAANAETDLTARLSVTQAPKVTHAQMIKPFRRLTATHRVKMNLPCPWAPSASGQAVDPAQCLVLASGQGTGVIQLGDAQN